MLDGVEECLEVINKLVGQLCLQESLQYVLVRSVAKCNLIQVVVVHELVEHVGTENHGLWNGHLYTLEAVELRV